MNVQRAQEIVELDEKIDVMHNGIQVWIDSVDASSQTASIHVEQNSEESKVVSVNELIEV